MIKKIIVVVAFMLTGFSLTAMSASAEEITDLFLQKEVTYSGVEGGKIGENWKYPQFVGEKAVDGDETTRWSADKQDEQWLIVDLGEVKNIGELVLQLHAESPVYEILVSTDGESYQSIFKEENGQGGQPTKKYIDGNNVQARFVKYQQMKMWQHTNKQFYSSSIISFEAYEKKRLPEAIKLLTENLTISEKRKQQLAFEVSPAGVDITEDQIEWSSSDPTIVTVDQTGNLTAVKSGEAKVTVKIKGTEISDTIPVTVVAENKQYAEMRAKWKMRLLGTTQYDNDADVQQYRAQIATESLALWQTLNQAADRGYLWERKPSDTVSADYTTQFTNIKKLALGYYEPSSELFEKPEVYDAIVKGIEFMIDTKKYNGTYYTGNWWDWQIGSAQPLTDTLILLHDELLNTDAEKLNKFTAPLMLYAKDPNIQWPIYRATGANLTDISITVLGTGLLLEDNQRLVQVQEAVPSVLKSVSSGDGLYPDGSLIQHGYFPYNGSYGNELLKGFGRIQTILQGSDWEMNDPNISNLFNVVDKGYLQLMVNGKMPSMVSGRSISRAPETNPFTTEFESGKETIANLTLIAKFAPENLRNDIYTSIQTWLQQSGSYYHFFKKPRDFEALIDLKNVVNSASPAQATPMQSLNVYGSMDRVLQKNNEYAVGISMYSQRVGNYEFGNTENKKGWHTADGMLYLYNQDFAQFDEGYWATIDPYRLPGTTVDTRELANGAYTGKRSPQSWVGGSNNGQVASIGMFLDKSNEGMNLVAKKSWFLLDGQIINLGSGITGTTDASIETILDNRMIHPQEVKLNQGSDKDNSWISLSAANPLNNIGYVFPNSMNMLDVQIEERSGCYGDINEYFVNDKTYTNTFAKISKNYGKTVENGTYEYLTVVGKTNEEIAALSKNKGYTVLENTASLQAIEAGNYVMMNTWNNDQEIAGLYAYDPMSVISEKIDNGVYRLTLANPLQNNASVSIEFDKGILEVVIADPEISVDQNIITLNSAGLNGSSRSITVKTTPEVTKEALEKLIQEQKEHQEKDYTASSWKVYSEALQQAKTVADQTTATQAEVDQAEAKLRSAVKQLAKVPTKEVDKTNLLKIIKENEKHQEKDYTASSWKVYSEALQQAQTVVDQATATQAEVDQAEAKLRSAVKQLVKVPTKEVDKTNLLKIIKENEKNQEKDYTASSWKVYSEALKQAQTVVDQATATQAEVDQAEAELGSAVKQLVKVPTIDKTNLLKIIKENEKNQEKDYTASSWKVYSEALQQAQTVADQTTATQAEVDQAEEKLRSAVKQLVKVPTKEVDKTNLLKIIKENEKHQEKDYTASSWKVYSEALQQAQTVVDQTTATQAEVDQAEAKLRSAVKQLVKVPTKEVDKTNLLKIIKENEKHQEKDYTASSWKVYSEALQQAQTVVDQTTATQAEVDQAEAKLRSAVKQLVKVPTKEVDKTNLLKIIKENEKHQEKDYTASSWKVYSEALQQAKTVADQTTATQAEVDQAEAKLRSAVKQLTLKNSGENKKEQKNGGNNGHLNTSAGVDQTSTKQVKPSSQGGFRKASQFLPSTGEKKSIALVIIGLLVIASGCLLVFRKSKSKK
ncbi:polysaccharide lyase family 8 super-sandwich domain-containing protein [Enterococcus faecalis]|uniref:polysaccharide lyase family 8 super-sandwich domain-containing protein n=24 Tax=Enterococcus faecalis TaxID=1351 RepID=UPI0024BFBC7E|nr:polysaccharide lyase family 8 super-sandwich domain-containing protein [Enterococcus faecalis]MDJ9036605.1 discoidin domain-containing protein [Enterococcus faecalis]